MYKDNVVFAFLGTTHDAGFNDKRWERWRPTLSLVSDQDEFPVTRIELFCTPPLNHKLNSIIENDIKEKSPLTEVVWHTLDVNGDPWDFARMYAALFDFAGNYDFQPNKEDYFLQTATGTHVAKICLFLLAESRIFPAKLITTFATNEKRHPEVWKGGINIIDLSLSKYSAIAKRFDAHATKNTDVLRSGIQTLNKHFNNVIAEIEVVSTRTLSPMLITGPTGAGKSHLVSRIHELRKDKKMLSGTFVDVNCATLRGDNAMSALFGHTKGAFTGAHSPRNGYLLEANNGTLFLDEIGELGLEEQAMLLKAIEEKSFCPLGSDTPRTSNFTLIAGTNRDLFKEVELGGFRADLLARINIWEFLLPPLSDRPEDIAPNLDFELSKISAKNAKLVYMTKESKEQYLEFAIRAPWPGNFRDLTASIERMATLSNSGSIEVDTVDVEISRLRRLWRLTDQQEIESESLGAKYFGRESYAGFSLLDRVQIDAILNQIKSAKTLAELARALEQTPDSGDFNWSDRGKKILQRFDIDFKKAKQILV